MGDEVPGSASRSREIQRLKRRGAKSAEAAAHAAPEAVGVPTRAAKEREPRQIFAHAHAGERACGTVSRNRARPGWSTPEAQGRQEPIRRWLAEPTWEPGGRSVGGGDGSWVGLVRCGL